MHPSIDIPTDKHKEKPFPNFSYIVRKNSKHMIKLNLKISKKISSNLYLIEKTKHLTNLVFIRNKCNRAYIGQSGRGEKHRYLEHYKSS